MYTIVNATKPRDKLINFHNKKAKVTKGRALHALQLQDLNNISADSIIKKCWI